MKLGFIGLGTMGKYMALNLSRSGELAIVNDVRENAFPEFAEKASRRPPAWRK